MKVGDVGRLKGDLAPSLRGTRVRVVRISSISTVTAQLLENANGVSCWKEGDIIHVQPHNIEKEDPSTLQD